MAFARHKGSGPRLHRGEGVAVDLRRVPLAIARGDEPELAKDLRIEERKPDAGASN